MRETVLLRNYIFGGLFLDAYTEKPKNVWDLKERDTYYAIDYGNMDVFTFVVHNAEYDLNRMALGNCFLTEEEAECDIERRKVETEMLRLGRKKKDKKR